MLAAKRWPRLAFACFRGGPVVSPSGAGVVVSVSVVSVVGVLDAGPQSGPGGQLLAACLLRSPGAALAAAGGYLGDMGCMRCL